MHTVRSVIGAVGLVAFGLLGPLPAVAEEVDLGKARENFQEFCQKCHGAEGRGDGPGAGMLNPKPRDFSDCVEMAKHPDDECIKVMKDGGASVGMSSDMQPWGGILSAPEINGLLALVRGFCKGVPAHMAAGGP